MTEESKIIVPEDIRGEGLCLRRIRVEDAARVFQAVDVDRAHLGAFLPWVKKTKTYEDELKAVQGMQEKWDKGEEYNLGIYTEGGDYLGGIGIHHVSHPDKRAEIGYMLFSHAEGQGHMGRALRIFQKALFQAGFLRLEIHCSSHNHRSAMIPLRNGYRSEGILRSHQVEEGQRRDTMLFALLKEDWERAQKQAPTDVRLETERLIVRTSGIGDAPAWLDYVQRNRKFLAPYEPIRPESYYTQAFWSQQMVLARLEMAERRALRFGVWEKGGKLIGLINFSNVVPGAFQACFLGYTLDKDREGKGLMTEALKAALPEACRFLGLHRVQANYMLDNQASGKVLVKLGFKVEGEARDYLRIGGQWRDHVLTSWTNPNWRSE